MTLAHSRIAMVSLAAMTLCIAGAMAQPMPTSIGHDRQLLIAAVGTGEQLRVTSPSFTADGDIPVGNTQYGDNRFPGLTWSAGPKGSRSYAIVMQIRGPAPASS
jgi:para-nitrobenzyl esterase